MAGSQSKAQTGATTTRCLIGAAAVVMRSTSKTAHTAFLVAVLAHGQVSRRAQANHHNLRSWAGQ
eukprot:5765593-Prorocentrum_lima.AAC.1